MMMFHLLRLLYQVTGLNMNEKTLGVIVHKIISYIRKEMKDVWEATIKKTHNWMIDETTVM